MLAALLATPLVSCGAADVSRSCDAADVADVVAERADGRPLRIVTTVAPITDIVEQLVAGTPTEVDGVVPAGRDSHTFEPTSATARIVAEADVLIANGLDLEVPTIELALANMAGGAVICELGDETVPESARLFDRSFPEAGGSPNPHVWLDPVVVGRYADVVLALVESADPERAAAYRTNHRTFVASVAELDRWVTAMTSSVPADRRVLLTYHDAYAYFGARYGWDVVGAVQPSSFDEPSPREVAALIEQVRDEGVTAIFGSEVYPSPVLERIADEAGAAYVADLRDDVLPGEPGDPEHSWQGLIRRNVTTIVEALSG